MIPLKGVFSGLRAIDIAIAALASLCAALVIYSFWPGSIGHDYHGTLREAVSWRFVGHQPPTAALASWLLTFGLVNPTIIFVIKVVAYFFTPVLFSFGTQAPLFVRIGAAAIVFSPAFFYLSPLLRSNCLQLVFLGLAIAAGLTGRSGWRAWLAGASLVLAVAFSPALHLGHLALVVLFVLWQFPEWSFSRAAIFAIAAAAVLWVPMLAVNIIAGNVDRTTTLYVSALNGIGGLYHPGEKTCLPNEILRGGATSPEEVYANHYRHPYIYMPIYTEKKGFKGGRDISPEMRREVIGCWVKTIMARPGEFIAERTKLALMSMRTSRLEGQFVWFYRDGDYVLNPKRDVDGHGLEHNAFVRALLAYGQLGNNIMLGSIKPYLALFLLTGLAVLMLTRGRRLFVLFGALAIFGFMMPQLLAAQSPMFRYFVEASYVAAWLSLAQMWILAMEAELPSWAANIRDAVRSRFGLGRGRGPVQTATPRSG